MALAPMAARLEVGCIFKSYAEFERHIQEYQRQENVLFIKSNSKRLSISTSDMCERIVYDHVLFLCKQGKKRKTSSRGIRPRQRSYKMGCGAQIRLTAKKIGNEIVLKVTRSILQHSYHPVNAQSFNVYPENRRVEPDEQLTAMIRMHVGVKELKTYIKEHHGVDLYRGEIQNLRMRVMRQLKDGDEGQECMIEGNGQTVNFSPETDLDSLMRRILFEGGVAQFHHHEGSNGFKQLTFASRQMKEDLNQNPHILIMECLENVNLEGFPLITVIAIDSHGRGRPVLHSLLLNKGINSILNCFSVLKSCFCSEPEPKVLFLDRNFVDRTIVQEIFPNSIIKFLAFNSMAVVKKAVSRLSISCQKMILELFKQQKETPCQEKYNELKQEMTAALSRESLAYFTNSWWAYPEQWAFHTTHGMGQLQTTVLRRMESYKSKIKTGENRIFSKSTVKECIGGLIARNLKISLAQKEEDILLNTVGFYVNNESQLVCEIREKLISFGADLVVEQIHLREKTTYNVIIRDSETEYGIAEDESPDIEYTVRSNQCSCEFFNILHLPCHHIFALRSYLQLPPFEVDLAASRFCRSVPDTNLVKQDDNQEFDNEMELEENKNDIAIVEVNNDTANSEGGNYIAITEVGNEVAIKKEFIDQYDLMSSVTSEINDCMARMESKQFNKCLAQVSSLLRLVKQNKRFLILDISDDDVETSFIQTPLSTSGDSVSSKTATPTCSINEHANPSSLKKHCLSPCHNVKTQSEHHHPTSSIQHIKFPTVLSSQPSHCSGKKQSPIIISSSSSHNPQDSTTHSLLPDNVALVNQDTKSGDTTPASSGIKSSTSNSDSNSSKKYKIVISQAGENKQPVKNVSLLQNTKPSSSGRLHLKRQHRSGNLNTSGETAIKKLCG